MFFKNKDKSKNKNTVFRNSRKNCIFSSNGKYLVSDVFTI